MADHTTGKRLVVAQIDPSPAAKSPFHYPPNSGLHDGSGRHLMTAAGMALLLQGDVIAGVRLRPTHLLWRSSDHGYRAVSAESDGQRVFATGVLTTAEDPYRWRVYAIDPVKGDIKWSQKLPPKMQGVNLLVRGDNIFVSATDPAVGGHAVLVAFDRSSGHRRWSASLPQGTITATATRGPSLLVATQSTAYYCD